MTTSAARPLRFGLNMLFSNSVAQYVENAQRAADVGFDVVLIGDHLDHHSPLSPLVAIADAAPTVRVGNLVLNAPLYAPALLARDLATVDIASGGRLEIGLGSGYIERDFTGYGLPFPPAARRVELEDRSSRPHGCPHQMAAELEARVLMLRDAHPRWGPTRIVYELVRQGVVAVPGRSSVYRALVRNGRIDPARRRRRRAGYKRWERGQPMELWQMDVVGGVHLCDGVEVKVITGIDDNSRFVVCATVVARATARPVREALLSTHPSSAACNSAMVACTRSASTKNSARIVL